MRTLFRFFQTHYMLLLFLLLEGIAVVLTANESFVHRVSIARATGSWSGAIYGAITKWNNYINLYDINERLIAENNNLRSQIPEAFYSLAEQRGTHTVVTDTTKVRRYAYLDATVVNASVNKQYNYLTLDKGSLQHVTENMAVVGPDGIVGIVYGVSEHFATVLPVINRNFRLSTRFKKNKLYGSLTWNGLSYRYAELNEIPLQYSVAVGDTLVVAGYSSSFPEGVPVGAISRFDNKDGNFYNIEVRLFTDFAKLYHVEIVNDLMGEEQNRLEAQIPSET